MNKPILTLAFAFLLSISAVLAQPVPTASLKQMKARSVGPAVMGGRITAIDAHVSNPI